MVAISRRRRTAIPSSIDWVIGPNLAVGVTSDRTIVSDDYGDQLGYGDLVRMSELPRGIHDSRPPEIPPPREVGLPTNTKVDDIVDKGLLPRLHALISLCGPNLGRIGTVAKISVRPGRNANGRARRRAQWPERSESANVPSPSSHGRAGFGRPATPRF